MTTLTGLRNQKAIKAADLIEQTELQMFVLRLFVLSVVY